MAYPSISPKDHSLKRVASTSRVPSYKSPLPSIDEVTREGKLRDQRRPSLPKSTSPLPSSRSSSTTSTSTRPRKLSIFPDPARLNPKERTPQLRIVIPSPILHAEIIPELSDKGSKSSTSTSTSGDDGRKGLARARERAQARKRANTSPLFDDLKTKQQAEPNGDIPPSKSLHKRYDTLPPLPGELRRKVSSPQLGQHIRRPSDYTPMDPFDPALFFSPPKSPKSPRAMRPPFDFQIPLASNFSPPRSIDTPPPSSAKSSRRLQQVLDMKISHPMHSRQNSSASSLGSGSQSPSQGISLMSPGTSGSSDDGSDASRKKHGRKESSSKLPRGISVQDAYKSLPSSVKQALGSHAQTESMGYLLLLPHEVVQLNEEHLNLEKQIESIKKELNSVRYQSAQLHEKMLDELRLCASSSPKTDATVIDKLLSLQIDIATVEVRLDHTTRRLAKVQHRRADVRERLLMHLAATHAMVGYERQLSEKGSTPPDSPIIPFGLTL